MIVKTGCYIQALDSPRKANKHLERYANLKLLVDNHLLRSWVSGKVGVRSRSQSHELQKLKWHSWSKDHVLHLVDKIVIMRLLSQEKKKGCFVQMYQWGLWSLIYTTHVLGFFSTNEHKNITDQWHHWMLVLYLLQSSAVLSVCALFVNWFRP